MSQIRVLTLDSIVPIKRISNSEFIWIEKDLLQLATHNYEESDNHPFSEGNLDWVEANKEYGDNGEIIALEYLKGIYNQVNLVSQDASIGYDIEVICENPYSILGYEVKTSTSKNQFHITFNELTKAHRMKSHYHLFFIHADKKFKTCYGYIIENPIQSLNLDFKGLTEPTETRNATVIPNKFIIKFKKDYLDSLPKIDLIPKNHN